MKQKSSLLIAVLYSVIVGICVPHALYAAESLTLTVTPPLFQVTQVAGSEWRSQLRVVNSNNYDIYVTVVPQDFHPDGETGNAVFEEIPKSDPNDPHRMSGWMDIPTGVLTIKRGVTAEIPFSIHVPEKADPGGHYAALIVSTQPNDVTHGSGAGVSSAVSSLFFLRVPGDVVEKGNIRDFYTENTIIQSPDARFVLRFENQGNVHIVPQGEIVITNMWGKVRGKVKINESSTFGNVLPLSTRKFEFAWKETDPSPLEVGRYTAKATIVYGVEGRQTVERILYFWIVPWKPVASILGSLFFFIWFISWSIRRYIKKALALERAYRGIPEEVAPLHERTRSNVPERKTALTLEALRRPLREASHEIEERNTDKRSNTGKGSKRPSSFTRKLKRNRPLIIFGLVSVLGISLISWYFVEVFQDERAYHVEQIRPK